MKKLSLIAIAAACVIIAGCVPITSKLNLDPANGKATWTSPKDVTVELVDAYTDTNGQKHLTVKNWKSSNNPEVLKAKGSADAEVAQVYVNGILQAVQAGVSAASTMGASSVTTAAINRIGVTPKAATPVVVPAATTP